ncbi:MAG: M1 family aminopeptidase [candidate division KSB1 bacterium]|nr:M1 family aminopeptidase [candidate division KSB1 bacterium]
MRLGWSKSLALGLLIGIVGCSRRPSQPFGFTIEDHDLAVTLFPEQHRLEAVDQMKVSLRQKRQIRFLLHEDLSVQQVRVGGQECKVALEPDFDPSRVLPRPFLEDSAWIRRAALVTVNLPKLEKAAERMEVRYQGVIFDSAGEGQFSRNWLSRTSSGIISAAGVYLAPSSLWYPTVPGNLSALRVAVRTPAPLEVVSQGALRQRRLQGEWVYTVWEERQPQKGIYLAAGPWRITQIPMMRYAVMCYFSPEATSSLGLERGYLEACANYLSLYERLLGPYPYWKFAVVENFLPTGYGLPSFTLIGSEVLRLPFIISTSLGHEICHNWWGNAVYVAPGTGNWSEGLTTYCAEHYYAEQQGAEQAAHFRMGLNREYLSYVTPETDFPLRRFRERSDPASRAIGYAKSAMVFHQLRLLVGDEKFWNALRNIYRDYRFRHASWDDFRRVFEEFHGEKLGWFFDQWLDRTGAPVLRIQKARVSRQGDRFQVTVVVGQEGNQPYRVKVPVRVRTTAGSEKAVLELTGQADSVTIRVVNRPVLVEVDPEFDVLRWLLPGEFPPALSQLLGEKKPIFVLARASSDLASAYRSLAEGIAERGLIVAGDEVRVEDLRTTSFAVLGDPHQLSLWNELRSQLPAELQIEGSGVVIQGTRYNLNVPGLTVVLVLANPFNAGKVAAVIWGGSAEAISAAASRLAHYGKYSFVVFQNGRNIASGEWQVTESPLAMRF